MPLHNLTADQQSARNSCFAASTALILRSDEGQIFVNGSEKFAGINLKKSSISSRSIARLCWE
jgi:hypothetical protein